MSYEQIHRGKSGKDIANGREVCFNNNPNRISMEVNECNLLLYLREKITCQK
jgi:hypothetical protein